MSKHTELIGEYDMAVGLAIREGGQLYIGGDKQGPFTIVRGSNVTTIWPAHSPKRQKLIEACTALGIDPYAMTGGRLARKLIKEHLALPYKGTYYGNRWIAIARDGYHWHCTKVVTGDSGFCYEFDIRAAYMSHYLKCDSGLLTSGGKFANDGGYLENLKALLPLFPKWFRLQFLGVLASHRRSFLERTVVDGQTVLRQKTVSSVEYGEAFNCVHFAILETFKTMKQVLAIAGDWCIRAHTDSFTLKENTPQIVQECIWEYLESRGVEVALKGIGRAVFYDLNTGFIGLRFVGDKYSVVESMREHGDKINIEQTQQEIDEIWKKIFYGEVKLEVRKPNVSLTYEQLRMFA